MKTKYTNDELKVTLTSLRLRMNQLNKEADTHADVITKTHNELMVRK